MLHYPLIICLKGKFFYQISWLCFDRLGRKGNNLESYIKIQNKSVTHPKSKIHLREFVLTKLLSLRVFVLTVILKANFIV